MRQNNCIWRTCSDSTASEPLWQNICSYSRYNKLLVSITILLGLVDNSIGFQHSTTMTRIMFTGVTLKSIAITWTLYVTCSPILLELSRHLTSLKSGIYVYVAKVYRFNSCAFLGGLRRLVDCRTVFRYAFPLDR